MKDLKNRFEKAEKVQYNTLQSHIESGGRIALTTDGWSGNNKLDYSAITAHAHLKNGQQISILLDIIELEEAVHNGEYLCKKLLEVTDRFNVTNSIISITRDNASPNNSMLDEFEAVVQDRWEDGAYRSSLSLSTIQQG